MIKKFFHSYPQTVIAILAVVFFAAIAACYSWAIGDIYTEFRQAFVSPVSQTVQAFDLDAAGRLDLHGIATGTASSAPSAVQFAFPAPTASGTASH